MKETREKAAYGTVKNKLAEHLQLGTITATNKHIAETLGVSDRSIAYAITKLTSENKIMCSYALTPGARGNRIHRTITWVGEQK